MNEKISALEARLQNLENTPERVDVLNQLSRALCWTEPKRAMRLAEEAAALAERLDYLDGRYVSLQSRGRVHIQLNELEKGLEYLQTCLDYFISRDDYRQVSARQSMCVAYSRQGDAVRGLAHLEPALAMARARGDRQVVAEILGSLGVFYLGQGDFGRALEFGIESQALVEGSGEIRCQLFVYMLMGTLYGHLGHYERGLEYLNRGLALDGDRYDTSLHAMLLNNAAYCYVLMGDHENAVLHLHRSLEFQMAIGDRFAQAATFHNLGVESLRLEDYGQALRYFRDGLELSRNIGLSYQEAEILISIGELYVHRGACQLALDNLREGIQVAEKISARQLLSIGHRWAAVAYERQEEFEPALRHYKQHAELEREIFGAEVQRELRTLMARYELEQQQKAQEGSLKRGEELSRTLNEVRALNQALVLLARRLIGQNQEKSEICALLSHDLRNPITAIQVNVSFIREVIKASSSEEILQGLDDIEESSRRLTGLISGLLDVSSLEAGSVQLLSQPFELRTVVNDVIRECRAAARPKSITLEFLPGEGTVYALADRTTTARAIGELLSNAIKFSPPGRRVRLRAWTEGGRACCEVRDQGPGLSEADQKRLFQHFERLAPVPTGGEPSSGFGLAIVKKLVEAMGGSISAQSELGAGAAFTLRLPVATVVTEAEQAITAGDRAEVAVDWTFGVVDRGGAGTERPKPDARNLMVVAAVEATGDRMLLAPGDPGRGGDGAAASRE